MQARLHQHHWYENESNWLMLIAYKGSYKCVNDSNEGEENEVESCPDGYEFKDDACQDVNECEASSNPCGSLGRCLNVEASFECDCPSGFSGKPCQDVDECSAENPCGNGGECLNVEGSYECECKQVSHFCFLIKDNY